MKYTNNPLPPIIEKIPHLIRHEKLYRTIHKQLMKKWFRYFVLFFIIGSIFSVVCSSFDESMPYRSWLYTFNYLASLIFTIEYGLRIAAAPVQYIQYKRAWRARLHYLFSFYGIIDFVAILPIRHYIFLQRLSACSSSSFSLYINYFQANTLFPLFPNDRQCT